MSLSFNAANHFGGQFNPKAIARFAKNEFKSAIKEVVFDRPAQQAEYTSPFANKFELMA